MSENKVEQIHVTRPEPLAQIYLGDGAYASFDGYNIDVYCDREGVKHWVCLEPQVFRALREFAARCWNPPPKPAA